MKETLATNNSTVNSVQLVGLACVCAIDVLRHYRLDYTPRAAWHRTPIDCGCGLPLCEPWFAYCSRSEEDPPNPSSDPRWSRR